MICKLPGSSCIARLQETAGCSPEVQAPRARMPAASLLHCAPRFEHRQSAVGLPPPWQVLQQFEGWDGVAQMASEFHLIWHHWTISDQWKLKLQYGSPTVWRVCFWIVPQKTGGCSNYRRKFRSQTSDNMDRWKSRGGKSQRKTKSQKKEDAGARKGRKAATQTCVSYLKTSDSRFGVLEWKWSFLI